MVNRLLRFGSMSCLSLLLVAGSTSAFAANRCEKRIHKAEMNLQKAVQRHGEHSRQAEKRRRELDKARDNCRF